jgi:DNA-binding CsgD family transcriptional regulator
MAVPVLGRERELHSIQLFLERGRRAPSALVLSGEPGIGKSVLWQAAVEQAQQSFDRVLAFRAVEAEATLSFGAVADLFSDVVEEVLPSLASPRRRGLAVALFLEEPSDDAPDPRAVVLGLVDAVRALAGSGPVLIAIDDLQWLDASSAGLLQAMLRRLRDEPVGFLATARGSLDDPLPYELERSLGDEVLTRLSLEPLTVGTLYHLLKERVGLEMSRPELTRLARLTGGNAFYALELGREFMHARDALGAGRPLPVPGSLKSLLGVRLAEFPAQTREVLLTAASAARPTVEMLRTAHADEASRALETAIRAGVVACENSRIRFSHPLLAAVCYDEATLEQRRSAHERLARVVSDLEERARHLALAASGPDAGVASALETAAERAAGRGATAAAAELAELAGELTPPNDPRERRRRLLRAADFHCLSGDRERAKEIPEQLLAEVPPGVERADVLYKVACARRVGLPALLEICEEALDEAGDDSARCARILTFRSWVRLPHDLGGALADGRAALERAERVGDPVLLAGAIARAAIAEMLTADVTPGLLERGVAIEDGLRQWLEPHERPRAVQPEYLMRSGDLRRARGMLEEAEADAEARGDEPRRGQILLNLTVLEWLAGRWRSALDHASSALELAEQMRDEQYRATVLNASALVHAHLGSVDEARAAARRALAISHQVSDETSAIWSVGVLGHLELARGNVETAGELLADLPQRLRGLGWADPVVPLWSDTLETLVALGRLDEAGSCLEDYEERARRLASPWAIEVAGRNRGLLAAARGDVAAALEELERTLAGDVELPYPFERARTLLAFATVQRRARQWRTARRTMDEALSMFEQLGARLWAERARAEAARIAGRRPRSDDLTATEERVAALVADGLPNKTIASTLSVSVHTVEAHLSRVYRKLGIRSRAELARRVGAEQQPAPREPAAKV